MSLFRRHLLAALAALGLLAGCATSEAPDKASRKAPDKIPAPAVAVAAPTPAVAVALPPSANAVVRDAFVLFSGGGTPLSNNYSQYLQAKAIASKPVKVSFSFVFPAILASVFLNFKRRR